MDFTQDDVDYLQANPSKWRKFQSTFGRLPDGFTTPTPSEADIAYIKANPDKLDKFKEAFGDIDPGMPVAAPAAAPAAEEGGILSDVGAMAGRAAASVGGGMAFLGRKILDEVTPGFFDLDKWEDEQRLKYEQDPVKKQEVQARLAEKDFKKRTFVEKWAKDAEQHWVEAMRPETQESIQKQLVERAEDGSLKFGDGGKDPMWWTNMAVTTAVNMAPGIGASGKAASAAYAARYAQSLSFAMERKASVKAAEKYAQQEAIKASVKAAAIVGAGSEGLIAGSQSAVQVKDTINSLDEDALMNYEPYREMRAQGYSHEAARHEVSEDQAVRAGAAVAVVSGLTAIPASTFIGKWFAGKAIASTRTGTALAGLAAEGAQEFAQEGSQQLAQNLALTPITGQDPWEGVLEGAITGAVAGGLIGGGIGAAAGPNSKADPRSKQNVEAASKYKDFMVARANLAAATNPNNRVKAADVAKLKEAYGQALAALADHALKTGAVKQKDQQAVADALGQARSSGIDTLFDEARQMGIEPGKKNDNDTSSVSKTDESGTGAKEAKPAELTPAEQAHLEVLDKVATAQPLTSDELHGLTSTGAVRITKAGVAVLQPAARRTRKELASRAMAAAATEKPVQPSAETKPLGEPAPVRTAKEKAQARLDRRLAARKKLVVKNVTERVQENAAAKAEKDALAAVQRKESDAKTKKGMARLQEVEESLKRMSGIQEAYAARDSDNHEARKEKFAKAFQRAENEHAKNKDRDFGRALDELTTRQVEDARHLFGGVKDEELGDQTQMAQAFGRAKNQLAQREAAARTALRSTSETTGDRVDLGRDPKPDSAEWNHAVDIAAAKMAGGASSFEAFADAMRKEFTNAAPHIKDLYDSARTRMRRVGELSTAAAKQEPDVALRKGEKMKFRHFSNLSDENVELDPAHYGTGIKGRESERGGINTTSLYAQDMPDEHVEPLLRNKTEYTVEVDRGDMYDASADPLGLKAKAQQVIGYREDGGRLVPHQSRFDMNRFEQLIRDAGYEGYHTPNASGSMKGQGRLFNKTKATKVAKSNLDVAMRAPVKQTDTPEFKKWFGDSHIYDANNQPLKLYHGTMREGGFSAFDRKAGLYQTHAKSINAVGTWLTTHPSTANIFAGALRADREPGSTSLVPPGGHVMPVYVNFKKPMYIDSLQELVDLWVNHAGGDKRLQNGSPDKLRAYLESKGFDSLWMDSKDIDPGLDDGSYYAVALHPEQIKSASGNNGEFDAANPDIAKRTGNAKDNPVTRRAVQDAVHEITQYLGVSAVVVDDATQLPEGMGENPMYADAEGVFVGDPFGGKIYLVAANIRDADHARTVAAHETVGHKGLRGLLGGRGGKKYNSVMDQIAQTWPVELLGAARRNGIDINVADPELRSMRVRLAAEELIAYSAERVLAREIDAKDTIYHRIMRFVRNSLRNFGLMRKMDIGAVTDLIYTSRDYLRSNAATKTRVQDVYDMRAQMAMRLPEGQPLVGMPQQIQIGGVYESAGPFQPARDAAAKYMEDRGEPYDPPETYVKVNKERAARIAKAYEEMKHEPENPRVKAAYKAMIDETIAQWHAISKTGLQVEFIQPGQIDPYAASPRLATEDVRKNNHLWVFPTEGGFGSSDFDPAGNPLLNETDIKIGGRTLVANDVFRIVHDYFGHVKEGVGFRADGEENAWRSHAAMYSPLARAAMTSETRGQNSWVNFGPYGEQNQRASGEKTIYADQKIGLLPDEFWTMDEEAVDETASPYSVPAPYNVANTEAFRNWFGKSKAVDENGQPLRLYHGTKRLFSEFNEFGSSSGLVFLTSDTTLASAYAGGSTTENLKSVVQNNYVETPQHILDTLSGRALEKAKSHNEFAETFNASPNILPLYAKMIKPAIIQAPEIWGSRKNPNDRVTDWSDIPRDWLPDDIRTEIYQRESGEPSKWEQALSTNHISHVAKALGYDSVIFRNIDDGIGDWTIMRESPGADVYVAFYPNQMKSAVGNNGDFSVDPDIMMRKAEKTTSKDRARATLAGLVKHLDPTEVEKMNEASAKKLVSLFEKLPPAKEFASAALAGKAKRGWYRKSAEAIINVFGADAPRFAALLSALSPQQSVEMNFQNAVSVWSAWVKAGRPTDAKEIRAIMSGSVAQGAAVQAGEKEGDSVLGAWVPNTIRALSAEDPDTLVLSGPKVDSFMRNLRGDVNAVTLDTWMANFAMVNQTMFSGSLKTGGKDPGKRPGYLAYSAKIREAAAYLTKMTGDTWTPAEVQETVWSWAKALYEHVGTYGKMATAREIVGNQELTDELINATPDFSTLFQQPEHIEALRAAGYSRAANRIDEALISDRSDPSEAKGSPQPDPKQLLKAADRLDALRADRSIKKSSKVKDQGDFAFSKPANTLPEYDEAQSRLLRLAAREISNGSRVALINMGIAPPAAGLGDVRPTSSGAISFGIRIDSDEGPRYVTANPVGNGRYEISDDTAFSKPEFKERAGRFFNDWLAITEANPLNERERIMPNYDAAAVVTKWDNGLNIDSLRSFEPGKKTGAGQRALKTITDLADAYGLKLHLLAQKTGDVGPSTAQLKKWYAKNGFKPSGPFGGMNRMPKEEDFALSMPALQNLGRRYELPDLRAFSAEATAAGEIMNQDYESLKSMFGRRFEEQWEANVTKPYLNDPARLQDDGSRAESEDLNNFAEHLYYGAPTSALDVTRLAKRIAKVKNQNYGPVIAAKQLLAENIDAANQIVALKGKAVKASAKRAEVKAQAAKDLNKKLKGDYAALNDTLESHRKEYVDGAVDRANQHIDHMMGRLAAAGWNTKTLFPDQPPLENGSDPWKRQQHRERERDISQARLQYASVTDSTEKFNDAPRKASAVKRAKFIEQQREGADQAYTGWIAKMSGKVGKPVVSAAADGDPWTGSILKVTTKDGGKQVWHTKSIINYTKYGDAYRQFPSLLKDSSDTAFSMRNVPHGGDPNLKSFLDKIGAKPKTMKQRWDEMTADIGDRMVNGLADHFYGIKRAEQIAGISAGDSGYVSARLSTGAGSVMHALLEKGYPAWDSKNDATKATMIGGNKGFFNILKPLGHDVNVWLAWMVARRADRLMGEGRENLFTKAELQAALKLGNNNPTFQAVAREYAEFQSKVLDFAQEAGIINPNTRALWQNADYVPFYRLMENGAIKAGSGGKGVGFVSNQIKKLKGGESNLGDPLENIVKNWSNLIEASLRAHAARLTADNLDGTGLMIKIPGSGRIVLDPATAQGFLNTNPQLVKDLQSIGLNPIATDPATLAALHQMLAKPAPEGDDIVSVWRDGEREHWRVNDVLLFRSLQAINPSVWSPMMNILRTPKRFLTETITIVPEFGFKNWFRDMWSVFIQGRNAPSAMPIIPVVDSVKGAVKFIMKSQTALDMMGGGASFEGTGYNEQTAAQAARRSAIRQGTVAGIINTPAKAFLMYRELTSAAENSHRVAVYDRTISSGGSRKQALFEAKDLMDFSMRGNWALTRFLVETVPFLGARMAGMTTIGRRMIANPKGVFIRGMLMTAATLAYVGMNFDDERYKELTKDQKNLYWHFWYGPKHVRIPKPFEIGTIFGTIPEAIMDTFLTNADEPDAALQSAQLLSHAFTQALDFSPQVATVWPVWELAINKNTFTGAPILNQGDIGVLPEDQDGPGVNPTYRWLAHAMPDTAPSALRSPKQLQHLAKGYIGTAQDYVLLMTDKIARSAMGEPEPQAKDFGDRPFFKSFVDEGPARSTKYLNSMYQVADDAEQVWKSLNRNAESGTEEGASRADELLEKQEDLLAARDTFSQQVRAVSDLRKQQREIQMSDMTPAEKKAAADEIQSAINEIARAVWDLRPNGKLSPSVAAKLMGVSKATQEKELRGAGLPATADLVNSLTSAPK
jgi:hypothetical protein